MDGLQLCTSCHLCSSARARQCTHSRCRPALQMVAQKQALLSALPADDPLVAASQTQAQAALDKQVRHHASTITQCLHIK